MIIWDVATCLDYFKENTYCQKANKIKGRENETYAKQNPL
jgi:hypothetical protein